jgi:ferredoxin-fold anticodon binding domain-containing protein
MEVIMKNVKTTKTAKETKAVKKIRITEKLIMEEFKSFEHRIEYYANTYAKKSIYHELKDDISSIVKIAIIKGIRQYYTILNRGGTHKFTKKTFINFSILRELQAELSNAFHYTGYRRIGSVIKNNAHRGMKVSLDAPNEVDSNLIDSIEDTNHTDRMFYATIDANLQR